MIVACIVSFPSPFESDIVNTISVMVDNTVSTMGDLIGFEGFLNSSVPFSTKEHEVLYRDPSRQYSDFKIGNNYNTSCEYPRFWLETGFLVGSDVTDQLTGCYDSDFDQVSR
jgi:alpha-1,3-glucan synthase